MMVTLKLGTSEEYAAPIGDSYGVDANNNNNNEEGDNEETVSTFDPGYVAPGTQPRGRQQDRQIDIYIYILSQIDTTFNPRYVTPGTQPRGRQSDR